MKFLEKKKILLIISGGIAAYKSLDLIRSLIKIQCEVKTILTKGGTEFVTPLSIASLSKNKVYTDIYSVSAKRPSPYSPHAISPLNGPMIL